MFLINPDPFLLPSFRISPFRTADIAFNNTLPVNNSVENYFDNRFGAKRYLFTLSGRKALNVALSFYNLKDQDIVTILTTTGNLYISKCVTTEIEKFCSWSRKIESNTKVILVNHEFGFPYEPISELKQHGIPIIEDCAHSFFSNNEDQNVGKIGDFVILSFPKMFPIQIGGLLITNYLNEIDQRNHIGSKKRRYIINVLSYYIDLKEEIINNRIRNYNYLKNKFDLLGFKERFELKSGSIPGVFMFRTDKQKLNLPELKKYFYNHGVQCSVFYGEKAFYIPVHQALTESDMDYFYEVMKSFIK